MLSCECEFKVGVEITHLFVMRIFLIDILFSEWRGLQKRK